jgi:hypothetical protein
LCDRLKRRIKSLQKTISWHKKMKATLYEKIRRLKAEKKTSVASEGVDEAATMG